MPRAVPRCFALLSCLLGLAGACASAASADTTSADRFPVGGAAMTAAEGVAQAYWGTNPCGGKYDISWVEMGLDTNAISTWSNPTSAYDNPSQNLDCRVAFNKLIDYDWQRFCTVLVHELGHLAGHDHSADAHDVMAAYYNGPVDVCVAAPAPGSSAAVVPTPIPAPEPKATAASRAKNTAAKRVRRAKRHLKRHHTRLARRHHRHAHH